MEARRGAQARRRRRLPGGGRSPARVSAESQVSRHRRSLRRPRREPRRRGCVHVHPPPGRRRRHVIDCGAHRRPRHAVPRPRVGARHRGQVRLRPDSRPHRGASHAGDRDPQMDLARLGVYGWSFGGYFAAAAVLTHPEMYKVAVAGAPPSDWREYDTAYTERYLGVPLDAKTDAVYQASSLLEMAKASTGSRPLLLLHGTADDNVYFNHSLELAEALAGAGRPFTFVPLIGQHPPRRPSPARAPRVEADGRVPSRQALGRERGALAGLVVLPALPRMIRVSVVGAGKMGLAPRARVRPSHRVRGSVRREA